MKLKIIKPKTRPIQIEPWFFRYLNEGQIKVVSAILSHADLKNRQDNSFPSNRTIAFYCGFGLIQKDTKAYNEYISLNNEEQTIFKNKRIKNAIQTVKNIKKKLEEIGLLKKELVGQKGREIAYLTLDLEWKKEEYINDFNEYFNNIDKEEKLEEKEVINNELDEIKRLHEEGNISKDNLATRLNNLSYKIKADNHKENENIPIEDIDKLANFIMNTNKIRDKVEKGLIKNEDAYKTSIVTSIRNSSYNGAEDYYKGLQHKELKDNLITLTTSITEYENEMFYQHNALFFRKVKLQNNVYISTYENKEKTIKKDYIIDENKIKYYLLDSSIYTKKNKEILDKYSENIKKLQEVTKGIVKNEH